MSSDKSTPGRLRIGVLGLAGKMGQELEEVVSHPQFRDRIEIAVENVEPDLWIEFSSPSGAISLCQRLAKNPKKRIPLLIGSTGWTDAQTKELVKYSEKFPILRASNFSFGIQLCKATLLLWKAYPEISHWKRSIRETHHTEKKDSPSGTAVTLRDVIGSEVTITSVREGKITGIHEVVFESDTERLTLIHEAKSRSVFAEGAIEAAIRLARISNPPRRLLTLDDLYLQRDA